MSTQRDRPQTLCSECQRAGHHWCTHLLPKPQQPQSVGKYGKTIGTAAHHMATYQGRVMKRETANRMYARDLKAWEASR